VPPIPVRHCVSFLPSLLPETDDPACWAVTPCPAAQDTGRGDGCRSWLLRVIRRTHESRPIADSTGRGKGVMSMLHLGP